MRPTDEHILIITDGSLASLLACLIAESEVGGHNGSTSGATRIAVAMWLAPPKAHLFHHPAAGDITHRFVQHQIDVLSLGDLIEPHFGESGALACSQALLQAASDAMARGCGRVIWPCAFGHDLDAVHEASERALAVGQLAALDGGTGVEGQAPAIETPFLDCTPEMLLQIADDLDAPLASCWLNPQELAVLERVGRMIHGDVGSAEVVTGTA